jgi:tripartite-type tricarboxylate transporter receptor subunit TctC
MVADPDIQRRMAGFGSVAAANTPAEFATQIRAETAMWGDILKRAGLARPA